MLLPMLGCTAERAEVPPTVFLLTLDTFRGDHVGASTPFLEEMAAEGLVLQDLDTYTWTYPGVGAILTGRNPSAWGVGSWTWDPEAGDLPYQLEDDVTTLAEALGALGWESAYWSSNNIAADLSGFSRGYGRFRSYDPGDTVGVGLEVARWLSEHTDAPRFVHVHVNDPHSPYNLTDEACVAEVEAADDGVCRWDFVRDNQDTLTANGDVRDGTFSSASTDYAACRNLIETAYRCEILRQDADLRTMWVRAGAGGALDDALTVIATDHGEALLDPWTNHAFDLRMPAMDGWGLVHWPGRVAPGTNTQPVAQEDLVPTMAGLLGVELGMETTGMPVDEVPDDRIRTAFFEGPLPAGYPWTRFDSAYDATRHYIVSSRGDCELYDRALPAELQNLCDVESPPTALVDAVAEQQALTAGYSADPAAR